MKRWGVSGPTTTVMWQTGSTARTTLGVCSPARGYLAAADGFYHLGHDGKGDLLGGAGSDIEPNRDLRTRERSSSFSSMAESTDPHPGDDWQQDR